MHVPGIHVNIELNKLLRTPAFKASENAGCSPSFRDSPHFCNSLIWARRNVNPSKCIFCGLHFTFNLRISFGNLNRREGNNLLLCLLYGRNCAGRGPFSLNPPETALGGRWVFSFHKWGNRLWEWVAQHQSGQMIELNKKSKLLALKLRWFS